MPRTRDEHGSRSRASSRARPVRPGARARFLWLRVRRRHQRPSFARHRGEVARGPLQPRAPRRDGGGEGDRRRRRHPAADAARLPGRGMRQARSWVAGARQVRRRDGVPASQRAGPRGHLPAVRRDHPRRGPAAPRLARRPDRQLDARGVGEGEPAGDQASLHRARRGHRGGAGFAGDGRSANARSIGGRCGVRAQAVRDPAAPGEEGLAVRHPWTRLLLHSQPQLQDHRLQGDAQRRAVAAVLSRPAGFRRLVGHLDGALAVLHQHVPFLGASAPVSVHLAQRRDQHAPRQHQLDARAPVDDAVPALWQRPEEDPHRRRHRGFRLGDVRQRPRAAHARRPRAAARDDDDGARAVRAGRDDERRTEGVLRVPFMPDGALGRAGFHRIHRRRSRGRRARSQWPAALALLRNQRRFCHHGF